MKNITRERSSARRVQVLFLVVSCTVVSACTASNADLTWVEPVQLASGEEVKVKRHVVVIQERAYGGGFLAAPIYKTSSLELQVGSASYPIWDAPMVPVLVDKDPTNGEWVVVAATSGCDTWLRNGRPRPPYWAFRLRNGQWYRDAIPTGFLDRPANLFIDFRTDDRSDKLNSEIEDRKKQQFDSKQHPKSYNKVDTSYAEFDKGCSREPSDPIGKSELDLKSFRSLP